LSVCHSICLSLDLPVFLSAYRLLPWLSVYLSSWCPISCLPVCPPAILFTKYK
jgi:hypothetical protein